MKWEIIIIHTQINLSLCTTFIFPKVTNLCPSLLCSHAYKIHITFKKVHKFYFAFSLNYFNHSMNKLS